MLTVTVTQNGKTKQIAANGGDNLLDTLRIAGYDVKAPCGGNGTCGQCAVLLGGERVYACRVTLQRDCEVSLPDTDKIEALTRGAGDIAPCGEGLGIAVDIGTTTVAAFLYDLSSGKLLGAESGRNAQRAYGSDVISRIQHCASDGGLEALTSAVRGQISRLIDALCLGYGRQRQDITRVSIAANTVMEHIYAGLSPVTIGVAPFKTLSLFGDTRPAAETLGGLAPGAELYMCPALAGYVGGDITAGLYAAGAQEGKTMLFLDIGTNGEMGLSDEAGYLCCATAAGPAFEGAEIECGMDGTAGAVSRVQVINGDVVCEVVGGAEAKGICGSGLIDALSAMLELSVVDETGRMAAPEDFSSGEAPGRRLRRDEAGALRFYLADGVYVSAADIRQLQLAKAAIRAGAETLLETRGKAYADVDEVLLAGGFGAYMDVKSACKIGLLPPAFLGKTRHIGNSAGAGAALALSPGARERLSALAEKCEYLELSGSALFMEKYIECIPFMEDEQWT